MELYGELTLVGIGNFLLGENRMEIGVQGLSFILTRGTQLATRS